MIEPLQKKEEKKISMTSKTEEELSIIGVTKELWSREEDSFRGVK